MPSTTPIRGHAQRPHIGAPNISPCGSHKTPFGTISPIVDDGKEMRRPSHSATVSPPFGTVIGLYLRAFERQPASQKLILKTCAQFGQLIGGGLERPIGTIENADAWTFQTHLLTQDLSCSTVYKRLGLVRRVFKWAKAHGYLEAENPFGGVLVSPDALRPAQRTSKPFTKYQLRVIFTSQDFRSQKSVHPERYWLTLGLLFTGARRDELAQLRAADIQLQDDIHYFDVTTVEDDGGPRLRAGIYKRGIPIHSKLRALGFLEYVASLHPNGPLFPQLLQKPGRYGASVSTWFSSLLNRLHMKHRALILHSFRPTMVTHLIAADVSEQLRNAILGRSSRSAQDSLDRHVGSIPLTVLRDAIEQLDFNNYF